MSVIRESHVTQSRESRTPVPGKDRTGPGRMDGSLLPSKPRSDLPDRSRLTEQPDDGLVRVLCPPDLKLEPAQTMAFELAGVPEWAVERLLAEWRVMACAEDRPRTLVTWRRWAAKDITFAWRNPERRPPRPETRRDPSELANERRRRFGAAVAEQQASATSMVGEPPPPELVERWRTMGPLGRLLERVAARWLPGGEGSSSGSESASGRRL